MISPPKWRPCQAKTNAQNPPPFGFAPTAAVALWCTHNLEASMSVAETMTDPASARSYKRVLLKISGEALMGDGQYGIDTNVCERIAGIIGQAINTKRPADWSKLRFEDYRRSIKLRIYRALGQAYHFDPMLWIKYLLLPRRYWTRQATYDKSIKPSDVAAARRRIEAVQPEK